MIYSYIYILSKEVTWSPWPLKYSCILFLLLLLFQLFSSFHVTFFFNCQNVSARGKLKAIKVDLHMTLTQRNPLKDRRGWRMEEFLVSTKINMVHWEQEIRVIFSNNMSASLSISFQPLSLPINIISFPIMYLWHRQIVFFILRESKRKEKVIFIFSRTCGDFSWLKACKFCNFLLFS